MKENAPSPSDVPLPWQNDFARRLLAGRKRWPQALLLTGRRGIGKRELARFMAKALLCERPDAATGFPCGVCSGCTYVASGQHPDLRLIEPLVVDEDGSVTPVDAITIDRIRDLIDFAHLSSHRQGDKVAVIVPAEAMNAQAANALLKTLEEPPGRLSLVLVSSQPARLAATIVSRCQRMPAPEPDALSAAAWLGMQGVANAETVLAQSGGAPMLALELSEASIQREGDTIFAALARPERLSPMEFGARVDAAPRDERKARLAQLLYWLATWTADLSAVAAGAPPRFHPRHEGAFKALVARVARLPLLRYHQSVARQRTLVAHPLQPRLVAEALLIEYRGLFTRGISDRHGPV